MNKATANKLTNGEWVEPRYPFVRVIQESREVLDPYLSYTRVLDALNDDPQVPDVEVRRFAIIFRKLQRDGASLEAVHDFYCGWVRLQKRKGG